MCRFEVVSTPLMLFVTFEVFVEGFCTFAVVVTAVACCVAVLLEEDTAIIFTGFTLLMIVGFPSTFPPSEIDPLVRTSIPAVVESIMATLPVDV